MNRSKPPTPSLLDEFGDAFNEAHRRMFEYSFEGRVDLFESIGRRLVPRFEAAGDPAMALEVRRRVAENVLLAASLTGRPVAECEALLARLESLGYTDLMTRGHVLMPLVAYYVRRRSVRRARGHLEPLIAELEAAEARTGEPVWSNMLVDARELRGRILRRIEGGRRMMVERARSDRGGTSSRAGSRRIGRTARRDHCP